MVHYSDFVVDSRIQRQARALAERGDRVDCVCLNDDVSFPVGSGEIALHRAAAGKPRGGARAYLSGNARFLAGAARKVSALDREEPFDLVEIHNMPDALVFAAWRPKLRGTPLILNFHDTFPELFATLFDRSPRHPLVRGVRAEERISAALADGLVFVTPEARDLLAARGVGAERTEVVMNTPDERIFGERREPSAAVGEGELRVVYHGGLAERFGVETLVCAVAMLRARGVPVHLDVLGSDAEAARRAGGARRRGGTGRGLRRPAADPGRGDPRPPRRSRPRRRPHPRRRLHRAAAAGEAARVRPHGPAGGRFAAAGDRALFRRRRALRRTGRPGLDRRRDRRDTAGPDTALARARGASQRLAEI